MDKYEYRVKTEQMLECVKNKAFDQAMEIADTIDWKKVKNASMISTVSEIYENNGEFQKSRDVLFIAYDRAPNSRKIIYRLGILALKLGDMNESTDCYEEFIKSAPKDPNQHILKYKILKAQKASVEQQIEALEEFKKAEYIEKWAFELAQLYDEAGMTAECLEECDDLILWFSEGRYVYEAMELKMRYKPLTPLQQEKFNQRHVQQSKQPVAVLEEDGDFAETSDYPQEESALRTAAVKEEQQTAKTASVGKAMAGVAAGMAAAAKVTGQMRQPEPAQDREIEDVQPSTHSMSNTTGQMKIEEILKEWEAKQREAAKVIREGKEKAEQDRQERERTAEEAKIAGNTGSILSDDIQQLMENLEHNEEAQTVEAVLVSEPEAVSENKGSIVEELQNEIVLDEIAEDILAVEAEAGLEEALIPADEFETAEIKEEAKAIETVQVPEEFLDDEIDSVEEDIFSVEESAEYTNEEFYDDDDFEEEMLDDIEEEAVEEAAPVAEEPVQEEKQERKLPEWDDREIEDPEEFSQKSPGGVGYDTGFVVQGRYDLSATSEIGLKVGLTEEQKQLFSYFVPVRGMSEQIFAVLENDKHCKTRYGSSRIGNLLVVGRKGSGKTVLAVDIVKAIQKARNLKQGKVAIVTGEALNNKELSVVVQKLHGGALIIENAGKLSPRKVKELNDLMEEQTGELFFVLEDSKKALDRILTANPSFKKRFTSKLELPVFINDELVTFGQIYAKENGYLLDEMGILALYSRIDMMQREDHSVTVAEVKDVMDEAIAHSQKANVKHLVKRVFGKNTDDSDRIILKEQDFRS